MVLHINPRSRRRILPTRKNNKNNNANETKKETQQQQEEDSDKSLLPLYQYPRRYAISLMVLGFIVCILVFLAKQESHSIQPSKTTTTTTTTGFMTPSTTNTKTNTPIVLSSLRHEQDDTSTTTTTSSMTIPRIMVAVLAYNLDQFQYFDLIYDSFRDICISGFSIDVYIYTTIDWPLEIMKSLESRMGPCHHHQQQHSSSSSSGPYFNVSIIIKDPSVKTDLARFHKTLFYENIYNYDLFIYTEEDHLILPRHVTSYLEETNHLKQKLGGGDHSADSSSSTTTTSRFTDYSIGFVRYERNPDDNYSQNTFEHFWNLENFTETHMVHVEGIDDHDTTTTYFNPRENHHQGMYMATREQFLAWSERPNCRFNDSTITYGDGQEDLTRQFMSSLWLYSKEGCNVTQLIPTKSYHDFFIHHLPDKYVTMRRKYWPNVRIETIGSSLATLQQTSPPNDSSAGDGRLRRSSDGDEFITMIDEREPPPE